MDKISYKTPFHVKDGKIFDAETVTSPSGA